MEKRVVLFLVLSLGIIFGYDLLLKELGYSPFSTSPIIDQELTNSLPTKGADAETTPSSSLSEPLQYLPLFLLLSHLLPKRLWLLRHRFSELVFPAREES